MLKAVIFDLDNVLIGAHEWHYQALNQALLKLHNYEISRSDHESIFNGLTTRTKIKQLVQMGKLTKPDIDTINTLKQEYTMALIEKHAQPDPIKIDLCQYLLNKKIVVGCYTNSIRLTASMMLNKIGVGSLIHFLITNEQVIHPKPHPEGYLMSLEILRKTYGITPSETVIVEDSMHGIQAAKQTTANLITVASYTEVDINLLKSWIE